ncbi:hypothetical protein Bca52824_034110, partial [Brassica carinata]
DERSHRGQTATSFTFTACLATRIDAAIWNNEVPGDIQELALTLNHVCQRRCNDQTKAVIMTLMMSVKSACQLGWFPQRESQQLLALVDSMLKSFTGPENVASSLTPNGPISLIPQVIERFYPFLKLRHILVSSEADSESMVLVKNFDCSKNIVQHSPRPRGLFVFRTDDISNSSCIIHPQEVSFSLNARGVDKRFINSMDSRPQRPTNVAKLLHPGTNLLQIVVTSLLLAYLMTYHSTVYPSLKDYVHSEVTESDLGPIKDISQLSYKPHTYQKLPVKGHACKHLQCFDFWNYIKINTRIPSWCCPHCHQSILEEVGSNVTDVVISPDGSWKVVTENDEIVEAVRETRQHVDPSSSLRPAILDLTRDENEMETSGSTQIPMLNQSSASLPQLPQTLNVYDGQQQFMNFPVSAAREVIHMPFFPTSSPQDTNTGSSHIPMPAAHSSQFQGLHVSHLGLSLGRDSGMMERWNHNYAQLPPMPPQLHPQYLMQNQRLLPTRSVSPVQERPIPSSITYPQTFAFNYGGTSDQRHKQMPVQRHNPGGAGEQFSSAEFMNLTPDNSANRRLHIRIMRGSVTPAAWLVQSQAQTLPPPQPTTAYSYIPVQSQAPPPQAFLANPGYFSMGTNETTPPGSGSLAAEEGVGPLGSFWSMPRET